MVSVTAELLVCNNNNINHIYRLHSALIGRVFSNSNRPENRPLSIVAGREDAFCLVGHDGSDSERRSVRDDSLLI